jgi:hypothetical protein
MIGVGHLRSLIHCAYLGAGITGVVGDLVLHPQPYGENVR